MTIKINVIDDVLADDKFNASLDQATDAAVSAFDWMVPTDQDALAGLMIELDNAISAVMSDYAPLSSEGKPKVKPYIGYGAL